MLLLSAGLLAGAAFAVPVQAQAAVPDGNWEPFTARAAAVLQSAAVPDGNWEPVAVLSP